ncbi:helix-turn-helix domain-containing protein [Streptomyces sp. NBC_01803]|uniref:helix-turn-helix domain-containing protein n=1 Tax=Streptomyces sp. NBC_01803 TaxID=2975946 RepID=UPI002DD7E23F|nr:helix-turn-helix transcriptional regulator [Streptomyces sp. NBC_01803]WSA47311.1 helix-turn-helix domain-containing protein [Streptomyces sp. NBC_01803]
MHDSPLPGDRLREFRRARGMTQEVLAERAGLSLGVVKKIERGGSARIETYHALARALKVRTSALFESGGPHQRRRTNDDNLTLMPLRQAIAPPATFAGRLDTIAADEPDLDQLQRVATDVARAYHRDDYDEVAELLPSLVRSSHVAAAHFSGDREHDRAVRLRANVLQMAGRYLTQVRAYDLAHVALRDAVRDADTVGDRAVVAGAVYQQGWLLMRQGRLDEAEQISAMTAEEIEPRISRASPATLGVWGKLLVHASAAAARNNRPREAREYLRLARTAGAALGGSGALEMSSWGRFDWRTVAFQGIENQLVAERPRRVLALSARMPKASRTFMRRHLLDVAQAHAMLRQPDEATAILAGLLDETPEWLRHQRMAADAFQTALGSSKRRRLSPQQRQLARFFEVT